jgi:hypothetical protein
MRDGQNEDEDVHLFQGVTREQRDFTLRTKKKDHV